MYFFLFLYIKRNQRAITARDSYGYLVPHLPNVCIRNRSKLFVDSSDHPYTYTPPGGIDGTQDSYIVSRLGPDVQDTRWVSTMEMYESLPHRQATINRSNSSLNFLNSLQDRKISKSTSHNCVATARNLIREARQNPTLIAASHFREKVKTVTKVRESTVRGYISNIRQFFKSLNILTTDTTASHIQYLVATRETSWEELDIWLFHMAFTEAKAWSTLKGYFSAVKFFYAKKLAWAFVPEGEYDTSYRSLKKLFKGDKKPSAVLSSKHINEFFEWAMTRENLESLQEQYVIYLAMFSMLLLLRPDDLDKINLDETKVSFQELEGILCPTLETVIYGAKNALGWLEPQRIELPVLPDTPLNFRVDHAYDMLMSIREALGLTCETFCTPGFSKKQRTKVFQQIYARFVQNYADKDRPIASCTMNHLRTSFMATYVLNLQVRPDVLKNLSRHRSTTSIEQRYLPHGGALSNLATARALENLATKIQRGEI